ncbi:MAG: PD-(D/E)XK nuclease family protein [Acidimicrobiales bacterium]|nr:PD-(D/E)XK nuclease family protein [Acidimicrobiales bacterium]
MAVHLADLPPDDGLNPAQADAEALLREPREQRPVHRRELRDELRALLDEGLEEVSAWIEKTIFLSKHTLSSVHGCEVRFLHELEQPFAPSAAAVKGAVAHKAIELSVSSAGHSPGKLVDGALTRLANSEDWVGQWLAGADELDRAEVRSMATDRVAKFAECFPPLRSGWRPVTESRWAAEFHGGKIRLSGKVDLTIGGCDGLRAGKVIIDFKTGNRSLTHVEDLRFYALLETLRLGVPPWKVATYYLDSGTFAVEVVTEGMLEAAARRVVAGAAKLAELREGGRTPVLQAGPGCSWCPRFLQCDDGQRARARWEEFG